MSQLVTLRLTRLLERDPWIDERVRHVGEEVDEDHHHPEDEHERLDDQVVAGEHRLDEQEPSPGIWKTFSTTT